MKRQDVEIIACCIHLSYAAEGTTNFNFSDEKLKDWRRLEDWQKRSCIEAAEHIPVKMKTIGCYIAPKGEPSQSTDREINSFTEKEIDALAKIEHDRFVDERLQGPDKWHPYEHGPTAWGKLSNEEKADLKKKRINGTLVSWDELVEQLPAEIEKDRDQVKSIPFFLKCAGLTIYRKT